MMYIPLALISWKKNVVYYFFNQCGLYKYFWEGSKLFTGGSEVEEKLWLVSTEMSYSEGGGQILFSQVLRLKPSPCIDYTVDLHKYDCTVV